MIEILKNNIEKISLIIIALSSIIKTLVRAYEYLINKTILSIDEALEKNEFDLLTKELLGKEKEKLFFYKVFKIYLDEEKRKKIIEFVKNSNNSFNVNICFKSAKYIKIVNNKIKIEVKLLDKISVVLNILYFLFLISYAIFLFLISVLNVVKLSLYSILIYYFIVFVISFVSGFFLQTPLIYFNAIKIKKYLSENDR